MTNQDAILARLDAIDRKLDYVVGRQRLAEEMLEEMTPIAGLVMKSATERLQRWGERGAFEMLGELGGAVDRLVDSYTPDDARQLADALVAILDTVRNVTQPEVLQMANEATDVLHHPEEVEAVGVFGAMRSASKDAEVQRGMGVALEVLRRLGRASAARDGAPARLPAPRAATDGAAPPPAPREATAPPPTPPREEVVRWEGHDFDASGFLIDPRTWTPDLAEKIAAGLGISLTDAHWAVIEWVRSDHASTGASPNVRRTATGSGAGTEAMYRLFPPTPGKTCAMIAGVPKPVGCV